MRILLLGANGQVGHALRAPLATLGEVHPATRSGVLVDGSSCERVDLAQPGHVAALVRRMAPDLVVNAAAYTAVDRAELEPDLAFRVNSEAVRELARACGEREARLVHYSTDYVFAGTATRPWREDDAPAPLNVYGASKLAGEEAIRASGIRHMILRAAWLYGPRGPNFLLTMLRLASERDELRVVEDQIGSPTPATWVAQATATILARTGPGGPSGTWHLAAAGEASWHTFAATIIEEAVQAGLIRTAPRVVGIPTTQFPTPARRPAYSRLDTTKIARDFYITLPDWHRGVTETIGELAAARNTGHSPLA